MISPDLLERINKNRARYEKQGAIIEKYYNSFLTGKSNQKRGASFKNTSGSEGTDEPALLISNFAANKMPILYVGDMNLLVITIINTTSEIIFIRKPEALNYDTAPLVVEFNPGLLSEVEMNGIKLIDKEGVEQLKNDFPNLPIKASADDWGLTHSIEDEQYYSYLSPKKDIELAADSTIDIYSTAFELKDTGIQGIDNQIVTVKARYFGDIESKVQKETKFQVPFNIQGQDIEDKKSIEEFLTYGFKKNDKNLSSAPHVFVSDLKAEHKIENEFNLYFRNRDTEKTFVYPQEGSKADNHFGISFPCGTGPGCLGLLDEVNSIEITSKIYSESYKWNVEKNTNLPIPIWNLEPLNKVVFPTSNSSGDAPSVEFPIVKITSSSSSGTTLMYINCKVEGYADTTLVLEITKGIPSEPKINYFTYSKSSYDDNLTYQFGETIQLFLKGFGAEQWTLKQGGFKELVVPSLLGSQIQNPNGFNICLPPITNESGADTQWECKLIGINNVGRYADSKILFTVETPKADFTIKTSEDYLNDSKKEILYGIPLILSWDIKTGINWRISGPGPNGSFPIPENQKKGEISIVLPREIGTFKYTLQCAAQLLHVDGTKEDKVYDVETVEITVISNNIQKVAYSGDRSIYACNFPESEFDNNIKVIKSNTLGDIMNLWLDLWPYYRGCNVRYLDTIEGYQEPHNKDYEITDNMGHFPVILFSNRQRNPACMVYSGIWPSFKVTDNLFEWFEKIAKENANNDNTSFSLYNISKITPATLKSYRNAECVWYLPPKIKTLISHKFLHRYFTSKDELETSLIKLITPIIGENDDKECIDEYLEKYILPQTKKNFNTQYFCNMLQYLINEGNLPLNFNDPIPNVEIPDDKGVDYNETSNKMTMQEYYLNAIKQFSIDFDKSFYYSNYEMKDSADGPGSNVRKMIIQPKEYSSDQFILIDTNRLLPSSMVYADSWYEKLNFVNTKQGVFSGKQLDNQLIEGNILAMGIVHEQYNSSLKTLYWIDGDKQSLYRASFRTESPPSDAPAYWKFEQPERLCSVNVPIDSVSFFIVGKNESSIIYWIDYSNEQKALCRYDLEKSRKEIVIGLEGKMKGNGLFVVESNEK